MMWIATWFILRDKSLLRAEDDLTRQLGVKLIALKLSIGCLFRVVRRTSNGL